MAGNRGTRSLSPRGRDRAVRHARHPVKHPRWSSDRTTSASTSRVTPRFYCFHHGARHHIDDIADSVCLKLRENLVNTFGARLRGRRPLRRGPPELAEEIRERRRETFVRPVVKRPNAHFELILAASLPRRPVPSGAIPTFLVDAGGGQPATSWSLDGLATVGGPRPEAALDLFMVDGHPHPVEATSFHNVRPLACWRRSRTPKDGYLSRCCDRQNVGKPHAQRLPWRISARAPSPSTPLIAATVCSRRARREFFRRKNTARFC